MKRASHHFYEVIGERSSDAFAIIAITYVNTIGSSSYTKAKDSVIHFEHLSFLWFFGFSLKIGTSQYSTFHKLNIYT